MKAYALTHVGNVRPINEDAYYLPRPGETFAAVADGMGGHLAGEVASALAIKVFSETLRGTAKPDESRMHEAVARANLAIYEEALNDPAHKLGMGTTLTAVWFAADYMLMSHVGDSRAYLLRNRALMQLSNDHSLVNEMVEKGEITPQQALTHPQRNYITRALGTQATVQPDILRLDYLPGDVWLLCTDGLSNYVRNLEIAEILLREDSWQEKLRALIDKALSRGGGDNITAVAVTGEEDGLNVG
ncbi:MAG: Stp1/IreP family PP2C-type Ser/Thr phosphatase [Clostridia bacterium]|nr:Stp1/IreP family PP2C-type Ser/Thr phosphatase [Clostridia bacterium]